MQNELNKLLEKSYSPYSGVKVSAILVTKDGRRINGVNIENAGLTSTVCAERCAIFSAIADGVDPSEFKEIHITANTKGPLYPCGVCRQVMSEFFSEDSTIHVWHHDKEEKFTLDELFSDRVTEKDIK